MNDQQSMGKTRVVRRNDELIVAPVDGELVMLSVEKGQYFGIGGVGTRIWELLESPKNETSIIQAIVAEFDVDEDTCRRDVIEFLDRLLEMDLIALE